MEAALLHPSMPLLLPLVYGFIACTVAGILSIGEGIVFMLLYNISRSSGLLGENPSYFKGLLLAQVLGFCTSLPIIFAGRHEMSLTLGYGFIMVIISLRFITMGVGMLFSSHEDVALGYAAALFMLFSFLQLLKATLEFGEERLLATSSATISSHRNRNVTLDPSGTVVVSTHTPSHDHLLQRVAQLLCCIRSHPSSVSILSNISPRTSVDLCCTIILTTVFPDDGSPATDRALSLAAAALIKAEAAGCSDMRVLLREDSLAALVVSSYCRRKQPQGFLDGLLAPIFGDIVRDVAASGAADAGSSVALLEAALRRVISQICARMHELPIGVKHSAGALIEALEARPQHQSQPLSTAAAVGSIVFLRYIVPYTVQIGTQHPSAQRFFVDLASALQKISNGADFPAAHKLSALNPAVRVLTSTLHATLLATCSACGQSHVTGIPAASLPSSVTVSVDDSARSLCQDLVNLRSFVTIFAAATTTAAAAASTAAQPATASESHVASGKQPLRITQLNDALTALHSELSLHDAADTSGASVPPAHSGTSATNSAEVHHWKWVSSLLQKHPNAAAAYERLFPNISESGIPVETVTIVLLIGTALSAICSAVAGAGGPPRIMAYSFLDLTKGSMRGLSWVFYPGILLSLLEISRNPHAHALVAGQTWLYISMAFVALAGAQFGTYLRQFVRRSVLMYGLYVLLWINCSLLLGPWDVPLGLLSVETKVFVAGSVGLVLLLPFCFMFPALARTAWSSFTQPLKCLQACCMSRKRPDDSRPPQQQEEEKTRLLYGTE